VRKLNGMVSKYTHNTLILFIQTKFRKKCLDSNANIT